MQRALRRAPPAPSSQAASGFVEHRLAGPGQACSAGRRKGPEQPEQLPPPDPRWADLLRAPHPRLHASRQLCGPARQPPAPSGLGGGRPRPTLPEMGAACGGVSRTGEQFENLANPPDTHLSPRPCDRYAQKRKHGFPQYTSVRGASAARRPRTPTGWTPQLVSPAPPRLPTRCPHGRAGRLWRLGGLGARGP